LTTGRIAAAHGLFNSIRQVASVCTQPKTCFLGPPESKYQTASRSVQPFLHSSPQSVPITHNGPPFSPRLLWALGNFPLPIHFPTSHLLLYLSLFTFSLSYSLYLFSSFSIPSLSTRIGSLRFQAGGCRRRPNLGLVFMLILCYMYFVLYVLLVKDACLCFVLFDLVLSCGVIVVLLVVGASVII